MSEVLIMYDNQNHPSDLNKFFTYLVDNLGYSNTIYGVQKLATFGKDAMKNLKSVIVLLGQQSSQEAWLSEPNNINVVILEQAISQHKRIIVVLSSDTNPFQAEALSESLSALASAPRYQLTEDSFYLTCGKVIKEVRIASPSLAMKQSANLPVKPTQKEVEYDDLAPLLTRAIAYFIDIFLLYITRQFLEYELVTRQLNTLRTQRVVTEGDLESLRQGYILFGLVGLVVFLAYFTIPLALLGQTLGKSIMKIKVVKPDGSSINFLTALIRSFGYTLSTAPLLAGFLWAFVDFDRCALHDRLAGTMVVKKDYADKII